MGREAEIGSSDRPAAAGTDVAPNVPSGSRDEMIAALFIAHSRSLVALGRLLTGDQATAEDLVQDAFFSLHRHWGRVRDPQAGLPYLQRCVVYGSRSQLRHLQVLRRVHIPGWPDAPPADGPALDHLEQDAVRALLARLPHRQRQVLVLRYFLDKSEREIADLLGISAGAVKRHASRGIQALTTLLEGGAT